MAVDRKKNDLFKYTDNFAKYKDVNSKLLYGNLENIKSPLISIVIPTYSRGKVLKEAIDSALYQNNQNYDFEIIVVDNDPVFNKVTETEKVISSYSDERLFYYKNEKNIGMFGNWNRCVELSRGKWVSFLHDDDLLAESYIHDIGNILSKNNKVDGLCSNAIEFGDRIVEKKSIKYVIKSKLNTILRNNFRNKMYKIRNIDTILWNANPYGVPTCGMVLLKENVLEEGGFNEDYYPSADWVFLFKYNRNHKIYKPFTLTGYYRWSVNESLKEKTLHGFMKDLDTIRLFSRDISFIGRIVHILFGYEQHINPLKWIVNANDSLNLKYEDFNYIYKYRGKTLKAKLYSAMSILYWSVKKIIALIFA